MQKLAQVDEYIHNVPVSINGGPDNIDIMPNITVPIRFSIDLEARSWGIKDVSIDLIDTLIEIPVVITYWGGERGEGEREETRNILVDLSKLRQNNVQMMGIITLGDLEVWLEKDFSVNYKLSSLEVVK